MKSTRFVVGAVILFSAVACAHRNQGTADGGESRINASSDSMASRDTAGRYGNQQSRMAPSSDSSKMSQAPSKTATTAATGDPNQIGTPAWWSTHITADGKTKP